MDSPYKPGFGARPAVLVGRDRQLGKARASLTRVSNTHGPAPSALVLTGARGMGKTVTLGVIADEARDRGFLTASAALDSVSDNVQLLAARIAQSVAPLENSSRVALWRRFKDRLSALSIELNTGLVKLTSSGTKAAQQPPQSAAQRQLLAELLTEGARLGAEYDHAGLAILIDEFQEAPTADLVVIANAIQDALTQPNSPLAVFAAGLPQTPERVMAAASFTERFDFRTLDRLDADSAERALVEPALSLQVLWDEPAIEAVLATAGGSPYLIQRLGDETWTLAAPAAGSSLRLEHAREAIAEVQESLGNGMFRGRWAKATPAEKQLMVAIAQVVDADGVAQTRHLTALTGRTTPQLSSARQALIDKGLVESAGHARLMFTMPGFAEFVRTQVDVAWYGPAGLDHSAAPRRDLPPGGRPQLPGPSR